MHIEARLEAIHTVLTAIHTALVSGAAVAAPAPAPAAETKADKPKAEAKPKAEPKPEPKSEAKPAAITWKDNVMPTLLEVNKSTKAGCGRDGLLSLMKHFGLPDGSKVPALEALNKNDEVLAAAKALLAGEPIPGAASTEDDVFG